MRIAYIVNNAAFFVSHRLELAKRAVDDGHHVVLFTGQSGSIELERVACSVLESVGIAHHRCVFRASGVNPFVELIGLLQLCFFVFKFKPDLVHCVSPKGTLYGGLVARCFRVKGVVLAVSGLGYAFTGGGDFSLKRKIVKLIYSVIARISFSHPNVNVIVQNLDDFTQVVSLGWVKRSSSIKLIRGSGVDLQLFHGCSPNQKRKVVLFPARLLVDKGIQEFVDAVGIVKKNLSGWTYVVAGSAGCDNPSAVSAEQMRRWERDVGLKWVGHVEDMIPLFRDAGIVCLPSYREGMPKALLEAAAAGCSIVTTDVPGCRDVIVSGESGILVKARDANALASGLITLMVDSGLRAEFGLNAMKRAQDLFSVESVVDSTINIYKELYLR